MKNTFFSKMLLTYLTITLALLLLLGVTASAVFIRHYISEREMELTREGGEIITVVTEKYIDAEKRNVAIEELLTIARKYDGLIQIKFDDPHFGTVSISNTTNEKQEKWELLSGFFDYMPEVTTKEKTLSDVFSALTDMRTMTLALDINENQQSTGLLCFTVDMTDTYSVIESVVIDVVIFAALGVVLAFIAVLYTTERMTRPIISMTKVIRRFSKGEYDARIQYNSSDEVGELAQSFNKMADEVNNLEEARRSFVANVSHELRSPLASMRGFLVAMQDGTIEQADYGKYLSIVIDENERMTDMVNDLLDMARIESGGDKALNLEIFDIIEVICTTIITFEARINEKRINVDLALGDDAVFVHADKNQIIHVLRNLVDNAIKFTPTEGKLCVYVTEKRNEVWITVKDSGSGIADEDMPYIFDRFYKANKAHTRNGKSGTGLGLSIAKKIIDAHGQNIYAKNDGGACFMFSLKKVQKPNKKGQGTVDKGQGYLI